jgi:hypothetical protein
VDGSEVNTDSPYAEADLLDGEGSILYLDEELLPVEERVTLLEVRAACPARVCMSCVCLVTLGPAAGFQLKGNATLEQGSAACAGLHLDGSLWCPASTTAVLQQTLCWPHSVMR